MSANIYTMEQWKADRDFKAEAGQEISAEVYEEMLNVMPPLSLPKGKALQALQDYKIPAHAGFMMGEPTTCDSEGRELYRAFAMNDYGKGKRYYYIGLSVKEKLLNGDYYYFDCLNAFVSDRYFELTAFKDEQEAINTAANYEATLYKYHFEHGELAHTETIYDPWDSFNDQGKDETQ